MKYPVTQALLYLTGHHRAGEIVSSVERVLTVSEESDGDGELVGKAILAEANALKGLMRKAAQLMGDRPDMIGNEAICRHLRALQSNCEVRGRGEIEKQMDSLGRNLTLVETVKAGTIGEVSKVTDPEGHVFALKTINPESKALYEADFDMFNGNFLYAMKMFFDSVEFLDFEVTNQIKAVLDNLFNSVMNKGFQTHIMMEFDLRSEKDNLDHARNAAEAQNEAAASAQSASADTGSNQANVKLMVPKTHHVSEDGTVLLTEWVNGQNIADYVDQMAQPPSSEMQRSLLLAMTKYYFNDLLARKRLHMDLHPGNMIIQGLPDDGSFSDVQVWIFDIGDELRPDDEEVFLMEQILHLIHCGQYDADKCAELWKALGVSSSKAENAQFWYFSKCFDLIEGSEGLNFAENAEHIKFLTMPQKVVLWQKATNAFVMTLQTLRVKFPEWQKACVIRDVISQALSTIPPARCDVDTFCQNANLA
jgi:hypothetical protein